jgi:tetratricopeptide (TPR) repeat protein
MDRQETPLASQGGPPNVIVIGLLLALLGSNAFWVVKERKNRLLYAKGIEEIQKKRFADAISDFDKALGQNPDDPSAHFGIAWAYQMTGQEQESIQHYAKSIALSEDLLGYSLNNLQYMMQNAKNAAAADKLQKARDTLKALQALR